MKIEARPLTLESDRGSTRANLYKRGYKIPEKLRPLVKEAHETKLGVTAGLAAIDAVSIMIAALLAGLSLSYLHPWDAALIGTVSTIFLARQMRGLENLVHEAAHYNWSRHHRRVNDVLATALAAVPVGARIENYRASHFRHHGTFGTSTDPDLQRYQELELESLDRHTILAFTASIVRRLPRYQGGWLREVGANPFWSLLPLGWAVLLIGVPAAILGGPPTAAGALAVWAVSYVVVLPSIRLIAESSEHIYTGASTVFDATISNLGWFQRHLFHPHNDGYHTLHHMWPGVPHHQLARLHRRLLSGDPLGYRHRLRYRTNVRQRPIRDDSRRAVA